MNINRAAITWLHKWQPLKFLWVLCVLICLLLIRSIYSWGKKVSGVTMSKLCNFWHYKFRKPKQFGNRWCSFVFNRNSRVIFWSELCLCLQTNRINKPIFLSLKPTSKHTSWGRAGLRTELRRTHGDFPERISHLSILNFYNRRKSMSEPLMQSNSSSEDEERKGINNRAGPDWQNFTRDSELNKKQKPWKYFRSNIKCSSFE